MEAPIELVDDEDAVVVIMAIIAGTRCMSRRVPSDSSLMSKVAFVRPISPAMSRDQFPCLEVPCSSRAQN